MSNSSHTSKRSYLKNLLALVKPRIIELLLVTAIPALVLSSAGWPNWRVLFAVVIFGTLAAAGANAWNSIIEKDIDALMNRTKNRPLVTGELTIKHSAIVASILTFSSILGMYTQTNLAAALLTAAAIGFYVLGYTILLKPRTNQNIVWGGIAGCFPVVIAEAAVQGEVTLSGWTMFAIIFFWTPAHYWPLAAHFRQDYALANIPMLPVQQPPKVVASWTLFYGVFTVIFSLILVPVAELGLVYLAIAVVSGLLFLIVCVQYLQQSVGGNASSSMKVFHYSISYLAVLFLGIALDVMI